MKEFQTVDISLIAAGCSCLCRHCYADARRRVANPIDVCKAEEIVAYFDPLLTAAEEPLVDVYYDLFDHPEASEMIRLLHGRDLYGYFEVIATNGVGIAHNAKHARLLEEMRDMGSQRMQLVFHGMEESHDWFVRRSGAFQDLLVAARAGIDAGLNVAPHAFANKRNVNELADLAEVLLRAGVRTRPDIPFYVGAWMPPDHDVNMEALLTDVDDYNRIKEEPGLRWVGGHRTEGEWREQALRGEHAAFFGEPRSSFSVAVHGNLDVAAGFDRGSRLGNIRTKPLEAIVEAYHQYTAQDLVSSTRNETWAKGKSERVTQLAREYGRPDRKKIYRTGGQALKMWIHRMNHAEPPTHTQKAPPDA